MLCRMKKVSDAKNTRNATRKNEIIFSCKKNVTPTPNLNAQILDAHKLY